MNTVFNCFPSVAASVQSEVPAVPAVESAASEAAENEATGKRRKRREPTEQGAPALVDGPSRRAESPVANEELLREDAHFRLHFPGEPRPPRQPTPQQENGQRYY